MAISPGARLGSYHVVSLLASGGMGEVYRARDTKLNRDVAAKVWPDAVATDADRIVCKPLALSDALSVAAQIVDALAAISHWPSTGQARRAGQPNRRLRLKLLLQYRDVELPPERQRKSDNGARQGMVKGGSMLTRTVSLVGLGLALVLAGCTQAPPAPAQAPDTRAADGEAIRAMEADWVQAFASRDAARIASFWSEDASVLMPDMPIINGRAAAMATVENMLKDPNFYVTFNSTKVEVSRASDYAYSQGTYTMSTSDPKSKMILTEKGKFVTVYKKEADGSWKAVSDIMNADGPPTSADPKLVGSGK
jgi:uncharacterized protein (TIGR02246 family)